MEGRMARQRQRRPLGSSLNYLLQRSLLSVDGDGAGGSGKQEVAHLRPMVATRFHLLKGRMPLRVRLI